MRIFTSARTSWVFTEETPLHPLASDGNPANIKEVLEEGVDINAGAVIRLGGDAPFADGSHAFARRGVG